MGLKLRLTVMQFFQLFIWGSWLLTIGAYWFQTKQWSGTEFGAIFSTMGISALFMPAIAGIIADRWINAEKLYAFFHFCSGIILYFVPTASSPNAMFWILLVNMIFYMPTLALSITVSYSAMKQKKMDVITEFPPIRVWGTIGFVVALWVVSLTHLETSTGQFYLASAASFFLSFFSLTMPKCPPLGKKSGENSKTLVSALGLDAFKLFKNLNMSLFLIFSMLLGAALQLTNAYGDTFLHDFSNVEIYKDAFAVKYPAVIMSISQISETLFILTIPFVLKRFGIKKVMFISMVAWALRFGLFSIGNPTDRLWMIVLSCIIYGMAFDFFNISGSLFMETHVDEKIRGSAQGLFMMMVNGVGAFLGSRISGWAIDNFFVLDTGKFDWSGIWMAFSGYAAIVAFFFLILFKSRPSSSLPEGVSRG